MIDLSQVERKGWVICSSCSRMTIQTWLVAAIRRSCRGLSSIHGGAILACQFGNLRAYGRVVKYPAVPTITPFRAESACRA